MEKWTKTLPRSFLFFLRITQYCVAVGSEI